MGGEGLEIGRGRGGRKGRGRERGNGKGKGGDPPRVGSRPHVRNPEKYPAIRYREPMCIIVRISWKSVEQCSAIACCCTCLRMPIDMK